MQAIFAMLLATLGSIFATWGSKLIARPFLEWALLKLGRMAVSHTKTKADDEWFDKFEKVVTEGTALDEASDAAKK